MFYHVCIDISLPDMRSLSHDSSIGLLEFLGFPKGSLWEHFSDIWVSIGIPLGSLWIPLGTLWIPLGTLLVTFGVTVAVLGPLGHYVGDFGIILGPSDCRKGPKSDDERC